MTFCQLHQSLGHQPAQTLTCLKALHSINLPTACTSSPFISGRRAERNMTLTAAALVVEAPLTDKKARRPDQQGRFGKFGGKYVPETLISALFELEDAYAAAQKDPAFLVCY